jgi:endoglucanase
MMRVAWRPGPLIARVSVGRGAPFLLAVLLASATLATAMAGPPPDDPIRYAGVNLAGAEFGDQSFWPNQQEVAYFHATGMNLVRVPFLWERMQPALNGPLDATQLAALTGFVAGATARGMTVLLDPHDFAHYDGEVIGSAAVPIAAFADFWHRLAFALRDQPRVVFGLMNEPYGIETATWLAAANAAIAGIRTADASQLILVPGNGYTGAWSWDDDWYGVPNGSVMDGVVDPLDHYAYELHQYFDSDFSGTAPDCMDGAGAAQLADVTQWLREHGRRGFLAELAGAANDGCEAAIASALAYVHGNADVWLGWAWWAAGPAWPDDYLFTLEPTGNFSVDRPQLAWLRPWLHAIDTVFANGFE